MVRTDPFKFKQMTKPPTSIGLTSLCPGVSIMLIQNADGWRFHNWEGSSGRPLQFLPEAADLELCFATLQEAVEHFRRVYEQRRFD